MPKVKLVLVTGVGVGVKDRLINRQAQSTVIRWKETQGQEEG